MHVHYDGRGIELHTGGLTRRIECRRDGSGSAIVPVALSAGPSGELIDRENSVPWFSLALDNRTLTSDDPAWLFDTLTTRGMMNGGTELTLRFTGTGAARGVACAIVMQIFPGAALCREKVVFTVTGEEGITMTSAPDRPLLIFPAYRFATAVQAPEEILVSFAVWGADLVRDQPAASFDDRTLERGTRIGKNLAQNYMYHPREVTGVLQPGEHRSTPGPLLLVGGLPRARGLLFAYEHGAPDDDPDQEYLHIRRRNLRAGVEVSTVTLHGLVAPGARLAKGRTLASVWNVLGIFQGSPGQSGSALFRDYLYDKITEAPLTRTPRFYYNTWGMQRDEERKGVDVREVLTVERIVREIDRAVELHVDVFVLDDGWQERFGEWVPHHQRFPHGIGWYADTLRRRGMIPGIWIAPLATDHRSPLAQAHPEWLVRDEKGRAVTGRWDQQVFCLASGYRRAFIDQCRRLIDAGIRYFKWDGIDKHRCAASDHDHGTADDPAAVRQSLQGYALPLLVTEAIRELRAYCPEVVVEVDVTEPGRSVGLSIAGDAKFFWMNNGAGAYGDLSTRRGKSTRFIPALYHRYFPPALQTYACYPHADPVHAAQRANVNSALIGGWGFWGDLTSLAPEETRRIGCIVAAAKRVLPALAAVHPVVHGGVGTSPEIYETLDTVHAVGMIIGFSGAAIEYPVVRHGFRTDRLLAVLRHAYETADDTLRIPFVFPMPEASREAFILPNGTGGMTILSSTSWLADARLLDMDTLVFTPGAPGRHRIRWDARYGRPVLSGVPSSRCTVSGGPSRLDPSAAWFIEVESIAGGGEIRVSGGAGRVRN